MKRDGTCDRDVSRVTEDYRMARFIVHCTGKLAYGRPRRKGLLGIFKIDGACHVPIGNHCYKSDPEERTAGNCIVDAGHYKLIYKMFSGCTLGNCGEEILLQFSWFCLYPSISYSSDYNDNVTICLFNNRLWQDLKSWRGEDVGIAKNSEQTKARLWRLQRPFLSN